MTERQTGTVKWFNDAKGFGFISRGKTWHTRLTMWGVGRVAVRPSARNDRRK